MGNLNKKKDDEVAFIFEIDDEFLNARLTLVSGCKITGAAFLQSLLAFVDDYADNPESLIESSVHLDFERH